MSRPRIRNQATLLPLKNKLGTYIRNVSAYTAHRLVACDSAEWERDADENITGCRLTVLTLIERRSQSCLGFRDMQLLAGVLAMGVIERERLRGHFEHPCALPLIRVAVLPAADPTLTFSPL